MINRDRVAPKGKMKPTLKDCSKCSELFTTNLHSRICGECVRSIRRAKWNDPISNVKDSYKAYEKTHKGFIMRLYRNMQSRVEGVQKQKLHLYEGKELLSREEFYEWALHHPEFIRLFKDYEESGYERKLSPSVDRVNSEQGYYIENMEWVTTSENSRRGTISKHRKSKEKIND